jgi:hypothetical protein
MLRKRIQRDEKVPLKLTATERKMVLDDSMIMDQESERAIQETPSGEPVMMTLGDLDVFIGYIAAEANHTEDKRLERKLDRIYDKIQGLLDKFAEVEDDIIPIEEGRKRLGKAMTGARADVLFQFKITLLDTKPAIWRRIQVRDCTLDKLHEHIQTAMGWTNSHLHQFEIEGERYGDPELLNDGFDDFDCRDSTTTMISQVMPNSDKRFAVKYEYDFGDGWEHEVLFEGCPPVEKGKKYPLCLEGGRACPPEDVGGVWGYQDFCAAIADPKHEEHASFLEWCGGSFSPDKFDPKKVTSEMRLGLPDWRQM